MSGPPSPVGGVRVNTVGGVRHRSRQSPVKIPDPDLPAVAVRLRCPEHVIEYYALEGAEACPMCVLEARYDEVKGRLIAAENQLKNIRPQLDRLKAQVDVQLAMRAAIPALDDRDYEWLKVHMYQYQIDKSVTLKPTHGRPPGAKRPKRGEALPVNGFMAVPVRGDPEAHLASSIGGLAMAEYLDEAITCVGSTQAMGLMLKAWWTVLPGGRR